MPDIVNPVAVKFCNEKIRPAAETLAQAYYTLKRLLDEWSALNLANVVTNTADPVVDGAMADGRPPLTGARANTIITRATEFVADLEANSAAKLNSVIRVSVNNSARF